MKPLFVGLHIEIVVDYDFYGITLKAFWVTNESKILTVCQFSNSKEGDIRAGGDLRGFPYPCCVFWPVNGCFAWCCWSKSSFSQFFFHTIKNEVKTFKMYLKTLKRLEVFFWGNFRTNSQKLNFLRTKFFETYFLELTGKLLIYMKIFN